MAITFKSSKAKQKAVTVLVVVVLVVCLVGFALIVLLPEFLYNNQTVSTTIGQIFSFGKPDISLNFSVVDSPEVANLQPFVVMETEFTYVVINRVGKKITGTISAVSIDDATALLEKSGYIVVSVSQMATGRSNPFISY